MGQVYLPFFDLYIESQNPSPSIFQQFRQVAKVLKGFRIRERIRIFDGLIMHHVADRKFHNFC